MSAIPKIWLFTDGHWHQSGDRIDRPLDHTQQQFANLLRYVGQDDLVIHCGDVTWQPKLLKADMDRLRGRWILVRGNHDSETLTWYMRQGFAFACDSFVFRKVLFTHAPARELPSNALLNVHGHLHNNGHRLAGYTPYSWQRLLAIENTKYCPVSFDKFVGNLETLNQ